MTMVTRHLLAEARALRTRLARLKPFALTAPTVVAAAATPAAQRGIEMLLARGRRTINRLVGEFIDQVRAAGDRGDPQKLQAQFAVLKIQFNNILSQLDIFADAITQRSQHDVGIWLAGLDAVASDGLKLGGVASIAAPPVLCYVDRGHGAAIRRARTRLPGGDESPVAVIRMPRERMVGSGIASSLMHEVGHQADSLLGICDALRPAIRRAAAGDSSNAPAWTLFERWIGEIAADLWSVSRVGISATAGLIGVVSLPRPFVFRMDGDGPHPFPWVRVILSATMGEALYPDPQWRNARRMWRSIYPPTNLGPARDQLLSVILRTMPRFVNVLRTCRPPSMQGRSLTETLADPQRRPSMLRTQYDAWTAAPSLMRRAKPSIVFAVLGQARSDERLTPERESDLIGKLLEHWALVSTFPEEDQPPAVRVGPQAKPFAERRNVRGALLPV